MTLGQAIKEMTHYEYCRKHCSEIDAVYYDIVLRKYYMKIANIMNVEI